MKFKVPLCFGLLIVIKLVSPTVWTGLHSSTLLPCSVSLTPEGNGGEQKINTSLLEVSWIHDGLIIAAVAGTNVTHVERGFSLDESAFADGNFSLTIRNVSLSRQGKYECSITWNNSELYSNNIAVYITAPPSLTVLSTWVVFQRESEIKCVARGFAPPLIHFSWMRGGEVVQPAATLTAVNLTSEGHFWAESSLTITPTDQDKYVNFSCAVSHEALQRPLTVEFPLNITKLPTVTLSKIHTDSPSSPLTLSCDIEGFYPEDITVQWLQNGSVLPDPPPVLPGPGGTFRTRHFRTLNEEERERSGEVQCVVRQPYAPEPVSETVDLFLIDTDDEVLVLTKSAKASVALMVISLVLVFLMCFGISWRKRDEKQKSLSVSGIILPPRVIVGQKGRVTVSVEGRRVDRVETAWFLNDKLISDTSQTEKGPLLAPGGEVGYYKLHTQRPLLSGNGNSQQLLSSLSFIPHISIHKGAVFKCQVSYMGKDKIVVERVSDKFTLLAAPEVSEIQLTEPADSAGIVTLTAQASRFHPDIITFRWFCQGGELTPVAPPASLSAPRPDAQGFFSASSQCRLPRSELERGETKVWVMVHHMALKQPITRETSGFIKKPQVSDIIACSAASTHSPKSPLRLGCEVTGFYPPDISVSWWRVTEDEEEEPAEGGDVWGPLLSDPSTYRLTASLREERSEKAGSEKTSIVCRVMHCSLQEPIERQWQSNRPEAPSIPSSLSVEWTKAGSGVFSLVLSGGHPKAKLLWAAGGAALFPLASTETEVEGEDGTPELKSVCTVQKWAGKVGQTAPCVHSPQRNGRTHIVTEEDSGIYAIDIVDERDEIEMNVDGEIKEKQKRPGTPAIKRARRVEGVDEEREEEKDKERGNDLPWTITGNLRREDKGGEIERLRVTVEITHPAFVLPKYRTWTEPLEES